jgi:hypothetical protein
LRITLLIDDEIVEKASELTGIKEIRLLVRMGLETLIVKESSKKLARLGGCECEVKKIRRKKLE